MRSACVILLLAATVADAKKNKDADRHLEQALLKESASYIDEAIEMGAVRAPLLFDPSRLHVTQLYQRTRAMRAGYQQKRRRWTDASHGRSFAGQDHECSSSSQAQSGRHARRERWLCVMAVYFEPRTYACSLTQS